ncbi:MAG TPA: hypothetical protein VK069_08645 [Mycolicibacillus parakoreensis]|uniref:Uncharacterized protein n=1 Tax=Mycolicibacillus parakoreensis TaxID=1069221 RepID=A0ABY3UA82_9MYCO|nr:hypothetical protein [Mycolicibacillus parakoreensis]ULN54340.1 hypothetical protein MIU77_08930 [Mycolicibacillus parakoreensis]HLR99650.1 hypothetical protein [Mycolicibacillus parakoreensis]
MDVTLRLGGAAAAALFGAGWVLAPVAVADDELHNITYLARVDGVAPGGEATFVTADGQTNSSPLSALPGRVFEANTVLDDPAKAGMEIRLPWPYSANVHCEIQVDDVVAVQTDQVVSAQPGSEQGGVATCGAPLRSTTSTTTPATPTSTPGPETPETPETDAPAA